jgi:hypothetical protein
VDAEIGIVPVIVSFDNMGTRDTMREEKKGNKPNKGADNPHSDFARWISKSAN